MSEIDWFLQWEQASRDTIDVKRCYIDIAGDLVAGVLLSQIVYWFLPGRLGSKLYIERDEVLWLAKGRADWWEECRISSKQFDRAAAVLRDKGLISIRLYRFKGSPTVHLSLHLETLVERVKSILTEGENPISPIGEIQLAETSKSLHTQNTVETTTKTQVLSRNPKIAQMQKYLGYPEPNIAYRLDAHGKDPIPNPAKEAMFIKKMEGRGFDWEKDIYMQWIFKVAGRNGEFVSMQWVNEDIGKERGNGAHREGIERNGEKDYGIGAPIVGPEKDYGIGKPILGR